MCLDAKIYRLRAKLVSIIGRTISWWDNDLSMMATFYQEILAESAKFFAFLKYAHVLHLSGKPCVSYWQYHYIHFSQYVYAMIFNCNLLVNCIELVTCWAGDLLKDKAHQNMGAMIELAQWIYIQCIDKLIHVYKDIVFGILQLICVIPCNPVLHLGIMIVAMHL